jgi:hypothetical protein
MDAGILRAAAPASAVHQHTRLEARLEPENARLQYLVGERLLEVTTSHELLG